MRRPRSILPASASLRMALVLVGMAVLWAPPRPAGAETLTVACSALGIELRLCREGVEAWAQRTGHRVELVQSPSLSNDRLGLYQQLLAARSPDIDVFQIDVIWPGILGAHFLDLRPRVPTEDLAAHFPALLAANEVDGALKALPWYTDVGLLYYRRDLLAAHGHEVPRTWAALTTMATAIQSAARDAGNARMWGYVFQGKAYEGLACNALEWIASHGGRILAPDGAVTLHSPAAVRALEMAAGWVGTIAPRGVLTYSEEEARGVFQAGHAVFMRNWPYAWPLLNAPDSPVRGKVGVAPLPRGNGPDGRQAGALGGWGLAVSRYSRHPALAVDLVRYLTGPAEQKRRAIAGGYNPTLPTLYEDPEVLAANPFFAELPPILRNAVARPAQQAGAQYNRISAAVWEAAHAALSGRTTPEAALAGAERRLARALRRR